MAQFKRCRSGTHKRLITADQELAGKVTARGTPNTFINGRKLTGAKPADEFKALVAEELKKAEKLAVAKNIAPEKLYDEIIKDGKVFEPLDAEVNTFDISKGNLIGSPKAKVQIVEFSDFQCPSVPAGKPQRVQAHGKDLVVAFKYSELPQRGERGSDCLGCAGEQGKFWGYHDALFANQKELVQKKWTTTPNQPASTPTSSRAAWAASSRTWLRPTWQRLAKLKSAARRPSSSTGGPSPSG